MAASDTSASFTLNIDTNAPQAAGTGAAALEELRDAITGDVAALKGMNASLRDLKLAGALGSKAAEELRTRIAAQKSLVAGSTHNYLAMGGSFKKATVDGGGLRARLEALRGRIADAPGPLGEMARSLKGVTGAQLGMAAGGLALAAGLVVVTAAALHGAAAVLAFGLAAADARRTEGIQLDVLSKMRFGYLGLAAGVSVAAAKSGELQGLVDSVSARVAVGRDKVVELTSQFYKMGLRGANLQDMLTTVAGAASIDPSGALAAQYTNLGMSAAAMGTSIKAVAGDFKARFGADLQRRLLSLDVITSKWHENLSELFSDVRVDGLLAPLKAVVDLFSQTTATGQNLKRILAAVFPEFGADAKAIGPAVHEFFNGVLIAGLHIAIVLAEVRNWFRRTFGGAITALLGDTSDALTAGEIAGYALAAAIGAVGIATAAISFGAIVGGLAILVPLLWGAAVAGIALAAPFILGAIAVAALGAAVYNAYKLWQEVDWRSLGSSIVSGILGGLKNGVKALVGGAEDLAHDVVGAFKHVLGIASPSRVMFRLSGQTVAGAVLGLNAGRPAVAAAGMRLGNAAASGAGAGMSGGLGSPRLQGPLAAPNGASVTIGDIHVHTAATSPDGIAEAVRAHLLSLTEGVAIHAGAG